MTFSTSASIVIKASVDTVWEALTNPEEVKQYFFGTNLVTSWDIGSPIYFRGEWEGKAYEDKGEVLAFEPKKSLAYTYLSSMSGKEDKPESYQHLRYILDETVDGVKLTITQENAASQEEADHSGENWQGVLKALKDFVEKN